MVAFFVGMVGWAHHAPPVYAEETNTPVVRQSEMPSVVSSDDSAANDTIRVDDQAVDLRTPSAQRMAEYETHDAYDYTRDDPPDESMGIVAWILSQIIDFLNSSETSRTITEIVMYVLAAIAIGYSILAVIRMEPRSRRHSTTSGYRADGLEDRVQETDFEPMIDEAMHEDDYRRAIRLMYLQGLQRLDRFGWIDWAPDRTNRQYEQDLSGTDLREPFRQATRVFEIVWYGDVDVGESDMRRLRPPFDVIRECANTPPNSTSSAEMPSSTSSCADSSSAHSSAAGGESE